TLIECEQVFSESARKTKMPPLMSSPLQKDSQMVPKKPGPVSTRMACLKVGGGSMRRAAQCVVTAAFVLLFILGSQTITGGIAFLFAGEKAKSPPVEAKKDEPVTFAKLITNRRTPSPSSAT